MEVGKAVILKVTGYSDNQKIIHAFTRQRGFLSFISPVLIFKRRNFAVQPMQVVEMEFYENERGGLHRLKQIAPLVNTAGLYSDVCKMNIALLWGEILYLILRNEQKNESLFDYLVRSVEYLNTSEKDTANFNLFFLYRLAAFVGFRINSDTYTEGDVFNINDGTFSPAGSGMPYVSGPNAAKTIYRLCICPVEELKEISLNRQARSVLLDVILLFYSIHLNTDFNVKSIQVIREVFS